MKLVRVERVRPREESPSGFFETVAYASGRGADMIRYRWSEGLDGRRGPVATAFSSDNGASWEEGSEADPFPGGRWLPPVAVGGFLLLVGTVRGRCGYRVFADGGRRPLSDGPLMLEGEVSRAVPAGTPLVLKDGRVMVPCEIPTPGGEEPSPARQAAAVLEGVWSADGRLSWRLACEVGIRPAQSVGGIRSVTVGEPAGGQLLLVMGADASAADPKSRYRWFSVSRDSGRTWGRPWPWTFSSGDAFFSSGEPSLLFRHSSGERFWIGTLCSDPPDGPWPGYPLVIGRIDPATLRLEMDGMMVLDTRLEDESEALAFAGASLYEDRATGDVVLRAARLDRKTGLGGMSVYTLDL